jgi:hypothetical protein
MIRSAPPAEPPASPHRLSGLDILTLAVVAIAVAKIVVALGLIATHLAFLRPAVIPAVVLLAHVAVFGGVAAFLASAGRHDRRAVHLGVFFVLIAVSFSNGLTARLMDLPATAERLQRVLLAIHPDAFLPLYLWLFVQQFPRLHRFDRGRQVERTLVGAAVVAGVLLFVATASRGTVLAPMAWGVEGSWFDAVLFGLAIPALPFGRWKAGRADARERRRYGLFVTGLTVGFLPMAAQVFAEATSPAYATYINVPPHRLVVGLVLYPLLLSIPVTTAYAVAVHRVMDVRLLVRRAVQYALARYTIVALAAAPALLLVATLVRNRDQTIGALVTTSAWSTLVPLAVLLVVLALRRPLLERIDRMFFREAVDTRALLAAMAAPTTDAGVRLDEVCQAFADQLRDTLHLAQADVLIADGEAGRLTSGTGRLRPLPLDSPLAVTLASRFEPMVIELDRPGGWVHELPLEDQQWLADGAVHLLMPLRSRAELVGVMALGEKLNDLPFSGDDQTQLAPVAAALALKIENLRLRDAPAGTVDAPQTPDAPAATDAPAVVCVRCTFVTAASDRCARCGGDVVPSQLPAVLAGKFRLERELGRGGMGVVYLAFDTALERPVAIKTLPRVSMAESVRLRREARAMAGFAHPHLALIFGLESWRGSPALVMEYLDGGTLADRLRREPMPAPEVMTMAYDLAGAIASIHDDGLLHRDIKPSNIAFTSTGRPKLLDFGLAQIFVAARPRARRSSAALPAATWMTGADLTTVDHLGRFAGTPAYMAPEAVGGEFLDGAADLWSFGVVLFECLTGRRPFSGRSIDTPGIDWSGEIHAAAPACPTVLSDLVGDLLARDKRQRPSSARVVQARLRDHATLRVA